MKKPKRKIDILVLSDIHLGTFGCHAKELLHYLKSIKPNVVVLNGDIIDIWQFSKTYWPKSHMKVIKHLINWMGKGIKTYYVTGNHDEMLRKFEGLKMGSLSIVNKVVLKLPDGKKAWVFHGDVFDVTMQHSKWLAKMGSVGYDILILINRFFNFVSEKIFNKGKLSLSRKIKEGVKSAVSFINNFEQTSADIGISNTEGHITYLNSGDWVENLSALEFVDGKWSIYKFSETDKAEMLKDIEEETDELSNDKLFDNMLMEFNMMRQ
jgi:UDP-2,3-diacylglucosamine pyrophosphatase LpxH